MFNISSGWVFRIFFTALHHSDPDWSLVSTPLFSSLFFFTNDRNFLKKIIFAGAKFLWIIWRPNRSSLCCRWKFETTKWCATPSAKCSPWITQRNWRNTAASPDSSGTSTPPGPTSPWKSASSGGASTSRRRASTLSSPSSDWCARPDFSPLWRIFWPRSAAPSAFPSGASAPTITDESAPSTSFWCSTSRSGWLRVSPRRMCPSWYSCAFKASPPIPCTSYRKCFLDLLFFKTIIKNFEIFLCKKFFFYKFSHFFYNFFVFSTIFSFFYKFFLFFYNFSFFYNFFILLQFLRFFYNFFIFSTSFWLFFCSGIWLESKFSFLRRGPHFPFYWRLVSLGNGTVAGVEIRTLPE